MAVSVRSDLILRADCTLDQDLLRLQQIGLYAVEGHCSTRSFIQQFA